MEVRFFILLDITFLTRLLSLKESVLLSSLMLTFEYVRGLARIHHGYPTGCLEKD